MLLTEDAPLRHALCFLERRDVARLVVAVLERGDARLARWLLVGDAFPFVLEEIQCLHIAVAEGCWRAALALVCCVRRARGLAVKGPNKHRASDLSPFERVVAELATPPPVVFPAEVAYRAAERGDVAALEWLHKAGGFKAEVVMRRAIQAHQLEVLEWLVRASPESARCALRESESGSLRASCWLYHERYKNTVYLFVTSAQYGYAETTMHTRHGQLTNESEFYPLADLFAASGDLSSLESVLAQPDSTRFFTRDTIMKAASAGHLNVVQWLVARDVRRWSLVEATSHAARNGHLPVVQWLFQFPETQQSFVLHQAIESGQLETSRWLWQAIPRAQGSLPQSYPLWKAAMASDNPAMLAFVGTECGAAFSSLVVAAVNARLTRLHVEFVLNKLPVGRETSRQTLLTRAVLSGTSDALAFMVDDCQLWSPDLLAIAAHSECDASDKVKFILDRAVSRARRLDVPLWECIAVPVEDLFDIVLSGQFDAAMYVLKNTPASDSASTFDNSDGKKPASHPDSLSVTMEGLMAPGQPLEASSTSQIIAFVEAFVGHRPIASRAIKWLPQLAVRLNSIKSFERLEEIAHPEINSSETQACIIKFSRNPRFMVRLLERSSATPCDPATVQWAAKYALVPVLKVLSRKAKSLTAIERCEFLQATLKGAVAAGHVEVREWVWRVGCVDLDVENSAVFVDELDIVTAFESLNRLVLRRAVFSHCPALELPALVVQGFPNLSSIAALNSIQLIDTNTTALPSGLIHDDLPLALHLIIHRSDLSRLPVNLGLVWSKRFQHRWTSKCTRLAQLRLAITPLRVLPDAPRDTSCLETVLADDTALESCPAWL